MSPYLRLRRWPEFFLILSLGVVAQFLDNLAVPQLFGAPLNRPVFVFNLLPLLVAGSILALLNSSWDEKYEATSTARSLRKEKNCLVGCSYRSVDRCVRIRIIHWGSTYSFSIHDPFLSRCGWRRVNAA